MEFVFATAQDAYTSLSYDLPCGLHTALCNSAGSDEILRDAGLAALFDIYLDQLRFARALIDLAELRAIGIEPVFEPVTSPILAYLCDPNAQPVTSIAGIFPGGHGDFARPRSATTKLRALKSSLLSITSPQNGRMDVIARGGLVEEYIGAKTYTTMDLNPYLLAWPEQNTSVSTLATTADSLVAIYEAIVAPHAEVVSEAAERAAAAVRLLTITWLAQAVTNVRYIERTVFARRHGDILIGAAPKMLGRILGRMYRDRGASVVRCAHGGERAFYDDYHWGLSELPFCDTYQTHGLGEAEAIARRIADGRTISATDPSPRFEALGSRRHQAIFRAAHEAGDNRARRYGRPRVLFAASSFLGESASHVPAIKPTDVHLADLQVALMRSLRDNGCEVWFKPHPKTMIDAPDLFDGTYDELVTGPFDPVAYDVDALMFDYAGSAFFDALASARGVILVDCGVRPFDQTTFADLSSRCVIVEAKPDEANRFRVAPDVLRDAVAQAGDVRSCADDFALKYFFAEPLGL